VRGVRARVAAVAFGAAVRAALGVAAVVADTNDKPPNTMLPNMNTPNRPDLLTMPDTPAAVSRPHLATGWHFLVDLHGIAAKLLANPGQIEAILRQAAQAAQAQILFAHFHHFGAALGKEQGVTGVLLLAESHITIHTWPECGFAAADIFMCGQAQPEQALSVLRAAFVPQREQVQRVLRGGVAQTSA
jgi:S-adenosylmethionine decarboxylase